jgi:DNA modification methylase
MKKEKEGVLGDNLNFKDLLAFNKDWIGLQFTYLKDNGSFYCWGIDEPLMDIYSNILKPLIDSQLATFRNLITWNKQHDNPTYRVNGFNSPDLRSYFSSDEKCLFVMCGVQGFNTNADNYFEGWEPIRKYLDDERIKLGWTKGDYNKILNATNKSQHHLSTSHFGLITEQDYKKLRDYCITNNKNAFNKEYDEIKKEYDELKKEHYSTIAYFDNTHDKMKDTWSMGITANEERAATGGHATPKPLELCQRVIKSSCPQDGLVLDAFLGSGSTLIAAEQTNRKCYGIELSEKYCDVVVNRWVKYMVKADKKYTLKRNGEEINWGDDE